MADEVKNQTEENEAIVTEEDLEKGFDEAMAFLKSQIEEFTPQPVEKLSKAKGEDEEEGDEEDNEEDEDDEDIEKSLEEMLSGSDNEDVAGAMDVEPFLREMVKSFDKKLGQMNNQINALAVFTKSMAKANMAAQELLKSKLEGDKDIRATVHKIADTPVPSGSVRALSKSKFDDGEKEAVVTGVDVLSKSTSWLSNGKINALEAGKIEYRINHGSLFKSGDRLDQKVEELLKKEAE